VFSSGAQDIDTLLLKDLVYKKATVIIDVRSPEEFEKGHVDNSVNIPLNILSDSVQFLREYEHIILVCKSGGRSSKAKRFLENNYNFTNLFNGGGWLSFQQIIAKKEDE